MSRGRRPACVPLPLDSYSHPDCLKESEIVCAFRGSGPTLSQQCGSPTLCMAHMSCKARQGKVEYGSGATWRGLKSNWDEFRRHLVHGCLYEFYRLSQNGIYGLSLCPRQLSHLVAPPTFVAPPPFIAPPTSSSINGVCSPSSSLPG